MDAGDARSQYTQAKWLHRDGKHSEALTILDALAAEFPDAKNIALARAECLTKLGDFASAADACTGVLERHQDARATQLLEQCRASVQASAPESVADAIDVDAQLPGAFKPLPAPRNVHRYFYTLSTLVVVGVALAGAARIIADAIATPPAGTEGFSDAEIRTAAGERPRHAAPAPAPAVQKSERIGIPEVPRDAWDVSETGVPTWQPGIYRQITIPGSYFEPWNGPRTIDVFIPTAYMERPEESLPTVTISMPELNPGFLGLEEWAERRGVILVALNTSGNKWHPNGNRQAQLDAYNFLFGHLRFHPHLNFTAGASGGANMGWIAAANSPDMFSGVLMIAHGGYRELNLAPHIRIAYLHGNTDWNAEFVREMIGRMRRNGNEIRHETFPGGHETGPLHLRTRMLDWLLESSRRDLQTAAPQN
jgi:hypothetical protein